ncbi:MAG: hypothetical protein CL910_08700 [Deltaproteobacteria bacterium]|jgi:hypothetical protein|nr:hypothetical protein [Deltaproteobacteria bacterium]
MPQRTVLLMDVGAEPMAILAARVQRLGLRAVRVKTPEEAIPVLSDRRHAVGAVVVPPDLPVPDLGGTLTALRTASGREHLAFLVAGTRMAAGERSRLARAGVTLPLWEPINAHPLRFQLNRAMAGPIPARRERGTRRAPSSHEVKMKAPRRMRRKEARLYTFSSRGVFLATPAPFLRGSRLEIEMGIPGLPRRIAGQVAMTNVAGNLLRSGLPPGMGIAFQGLGSDAEARLEMLVEKVLRRLEL